MEEVIGPYTVSRDRLGEGGQVSGEGEGVFRGRITETGQEVAVKKFFFARIVEAPDVGERTSKYTRLRREVENAWMLSSHPGVVSLLDVCFDEARQYLCLVMELAEGKDLFETVAAGALREDIAAGFLHQVAVVLRWVHHMGVCHRDLKLENVMLCADGKTIKVADWGMSKDFARGSMTETRLRIGTLSYLSPELLIDSGSGAASLEAYQPEPVDMWALGVMLYVMVSAAVAAYDHGIMASKRRN
eukprot:COSAG01_NODE_8415_length_2790_cov_28.153475_1_plen_245_part_00